MSHWIGVSTSAPQIPATRPSRAKYLIVSAGRRDQESGPPGRRDNDSLTGLTCNTAEQGGRNTVLQAEAEHTPQTQGNEKCHPAGRNRVAVWARGGGPATGLARNTRGTGGAPQAER